MEIVCENACSFVGYSLYLGLVVGLNIFLLSLSDDCWAPYIAYPVAAAAALYLSAPGQGTITKESQHPLVRIASLGGGSSNKVAAQPGTAPAAEAQVVLQQPSAALLLEVGQCVWVHYDELNCHWPCIFSGDGTKDVGKEALVISLPLSLNEEGEVMMKDMCYPFLDHLTHFESKPPLASAHPKYSRLFRIAVETAATRARGEHDSYTR
jgi:hypothetical protein